MMIKKYGFVKAIVGSSVRVRIDGGVEKEFVLDFPDKTDIGRISYKSPIGRALLGHYCGETVTVDIMGNKKTIEILAVDGSDGSVYDEQLNAKRNSNRVWWNE